MTLESKLLDRVAAHCRTLFPKGSSILAAVSGGGDSTALLLVLHALKKKLEIDRLGVLHVNHGLRGKESDGEESSVAGLAKRLRAPFFVKRLSGRTLCESGMEEWAREERYRFFLEIKKKEGFDYVATGHTADDQAETVFFRLMRGTGLRGLRGVLAKRDDGVVRPLLTVRGRDLQSWLKAGRVPFHHDSSNDDDAYSRNRIRHALLPLLNRREEDASEKLLRISREAQDFWKLFEPGVGSWIEKYVEKRAVAFGVRKAGFEDSIHSSEGLRSVFGEYGIPTDSFHIDEILASVARKSGVLLLPVGWRCRFHRDTIFFGKESSDRRVAKFRFPLAVPGSTVCSGQQVRFDVMELESPPRKIPRDNLTVLLDRSCCGDALTFRSWNDNDRFQPLGRASSTTVREFLAKQGVPAFDRLEKGVVEGKKGKIVWIPGVQIAHDCALTPGSRRLLKISYQSCISII
jgi:tRNA(Ile)-lysidine synthase